MYEYLSTYVFIGTVAARLLMLTLKFSEIKSQSLLGVGYSQARDS